MSRRSVRFALAAALAAAACSTDYEERIVFDDDFSRHGDSVMPAKGATVGDFAVDAVYTGDRGEVAGTRWVHRVHGMPVTVLRIQSVPQVFLAFHTPPNSDRGEPHTGEHLLLGKGTKGKALSLEQDMSLVSSTAWTAQTDVCYSWSCAAGKETFFRSVEQYLDALLDPDYSDEEIRREVCHIGPVKDDATGRLSLDEKGTIYQEMTTTYEKRWMIFDQIGRRLWGADHPLAFSAGGEPSAVRTVEPHHVRDFHNAHYHLGKATQMIVALPDAIPEAEFLTRLTAQMAEVDARPAMKSRGKFDPPIPPARPQADHSPVILPYPNANEDDGGMAEIAWKPVPLTSQYDRVLGDLFMATLASGENATLYKRLMDGATREVDVGASDLGGSLDASKIDLMPNIYLDGVPPRNAAPERLAAIVGVVRSEIERVAALREGSPELKTWNDKALVKITEREKGLKRQLNAPPLFGHRSAGGFWLDHLRLLDQGGGFERSVTLAPAFAKIRAELGRGANPWTAVIARLGLSSEPYVGISVPSKAELERRTSEHAKRALGYVADLAQRSGGGDAQEALAKFAKEYEVKTAALAQAENSLAKPHLVADVPLTPDPSIRLEPMEVAGAKGFRGVFDNMTFVETSLSFPVENVTESEDLSWLAILPQVLTESGVVIDGKPVAYAEAAERRAKEIYSLSADWSMRPSKSRHELRITASGADLAEAKRAIDWLELCLKHAWIAPENLLRLRDIVSQEIQATRGRLGGADENWVRDPAGAVRWQRDHIFLATSSIHARLFLLARCEWRLMDAPIGEDLRNVNAGLDAIAASAGADLASTTSNVDALVASWKQSKSPASSTWLVPIGLRIKEMVGDMAPTTIAKDLATLADTCRRDLSAPSGRRLDGLKSLVTWQCAGRPRFVVTGSRANTDAVVPRLGTLLASYSGEQRRRPAVDPYPLIALRLAEHESLVSPPLHYGLVHNAGTAGVFVFSANAAGLDDLDPATLTTELAGRVFGGSGAHGFFMKTWGAGLAYSNGLSVNANEGRINYYAERCPDLVQTMSFVSGLVRDSAALTDPYLAEYCVANAVTYSRESDEYEQRTRAASDDIVDGDTPARIARYRSAVLAMKDRAGLWASIQPQIIAAAGRALPGVGPASRSVAGGFYFTIAPEPMLARWEKYLRDHEGSTERVARVYGRDFWMVP